MFVRAAESLVLSLGSGLVSSSQPEMPTSLPNISNPAEIRNANVTRVPADADSAGPRRQVHHERFAEQLRLLDRALHPAPSVVGDGAVVAQHEVFVRSELDRLVRGVPPAAPSVVNVAIDRESRDLDGDAAGSDPHGNAGRFGFVRWALPGGKQEHAVDGRQHLAVERGKLQLKRIVQGAGRAARVAE